ASPLPAVDAGPARAFASRAEAQSARARPGVRPRVATSGAQRGPSTALIVRRRLWLARRVRGFRRRGELPCPPRAPALPAKQLPLPSLRDRLALPPSRLLRPPSPPAPHPAFSLWPLRTHLQQPKLLSRLLAQAPRRPGRCRLPALGLFRLSPDRPRGAL